ncbi:phage major capsid protein [Enterobacter hormaechei]|uniref:phage major capsid protein n=1 Tax=Enterobacter hormaechei TaxID=158836 RepID=UPI000735316D|nr:phage major capsid protein [Enterobacter hormaechei]MCI9500183.1 phage major capsid protein [Enterobacter hormaechei subsp. steigerwaltii]ELD3428702.1 phage major capsid protein [Enterobacter hormaechei]KTI34510.1 phage capsid protein [Enterobacter hormaechei subsp. xiangfangensis]KTJ89407.1 phage capsid protein [Enterobacter hormaechei subsp. xiangfangensis]MCG0490417.1 phage major capsid protein [Enterobacter hormaechei]
MKLHEMQQKRNTIAADMRALHDKIGESTWTEEQRSEWNNAKSELKKLDEAIAREEELRALDDDEVRGRENEQRNKLNKNNPGTPQDEQRAAVFDSFIRRGIGDLSTEEQQIMREMRAMGEGQADKGGYTVPVQMMNQVIESMKAYGGIANIAQVMYTSNGQEIDWPTSDGTAEEGELIGENTAATELDTSFGSVSVGAKKLSSRIIRVSNELLQDSAINMEAFLANRIGERIGRTESRLIVQGTGAGSPVQPKGLNAAVTGTVAAAKSNTFTWQEMNKLKHAVDPAYRRGMKFRWAFNDNTLEAIEEMVDAQNRPLWLPSVAGGTPATVLQVPYEIDQAIADIGSGNKFIFCGDFSRFLIRRVRYMSLKRLVERYAEYDQVGFLAFYRFDTALEDVAAIKALVGGAATAK